MKEFCASAVRNAERKVIIEEYFWVRHKQKENHKELALSESI